MSTLVQAIALDGIRAAMILDGPINAPSFTGSCNWLLIPALKLVYPLVFDCETLKLW